MGIKNRVALITGSASGMGKQSAKIMAENGARIVINDIVPEKVEETVKEYKDAGFDVIGKVADISKKDQVDNMVKEVVDAFGSIDILVNNAGMSKDNALRRIEEKDWDLTVTINLKGAFLCCRAVQEYMAEKKHGRIINIASRAWLGGAGQTAYSAAKAGMVGMTRTHALELGRVGITSNCIAPGLIYTPMWDKADEKMKKYLISKQPIGKLGDVEDIANTVMFFADDDASFITGQVFYVCGGRSLFAG